MLSSGQLALLHLCAPLVSVGPPSGRLVLVVTTSGPRESHLAARVVSGPPQRRPAWSPSHPRAYQYGQRVSYSDWQPNLTPSHTCVARWAHEPGGLSPRWGGWLTKEKEGVLPEGGGKNAGQAELRASARVIHAHPVTAGPKRSPGLC